MRTSENRENTQLTHFQVNCWNCEMGLENMGTIANLVSPKSCFLLTAFVSFTRVAHVRNFDV